MVWIMIKIDVLSAQIWIQTVCKGYQQMTKVAASKARASKQALDVVEKLPSLPEPHALA